jgi:S-adenosylmethionine hydrolase
LAHKSDEEHIARPLRQRNGGKGQLVSFITLTTDFGTRDWFVGTMKGVILALNPRASIVDITHEISPGDIHAGAFALAASCRFFPKGTVHVAVVDPGVGSVRKAIAVQTANYFFIGPDNGVLSFALVKEKIKATRALENSALFLQPVSRTFHGRDIFAPVAAHLSRGLAMQKLGPSLREFVRLDWPEARVRRGRIEGQVVYIDRFGNAITNIPSQSLAARRALSCEVWAKGKQLCPVKDFYQSVPVKHPVAVAGSSGFLEIAINGGNAARRLRLQAGSLITVCAGRAGTSSQARP